MSGKKCNILKKTYIWKWMWITDKRKLNFFFITIMHQIYRISNPNIRHDNQVGEMVANEWKFRFRSLPKSSQSFNNWLDFGHGFMWLCVSFERSSFLPHIININYYYWSFILILYCFIKLNFNFNFVKCFRKREKKKNCC